MKLRRGDFETTSRQLSEVLRHYDSLDLELYRLIRGWQQLTPDIRRTVGNLAPELVEAVLAIEGKRNA